MYMLYMLHGFWGQKYWVDASTSYKKYVDAVRPNPRPTTPLLKLHLEIAHKGIQNKDFCSQQT